MTARYSMFQSRAVTDPNVTDRELRVLALLGTYSDKDGWSFPHQKTLAERLQTSRQLINRSIKKLVDLGYIAKRYKYREDGGIKGCEYRIVMDGPDCEEAPCTADGTTPEPVGALPLSPSEVTTPVTPEGDSNNVPNEQSKLTHSQPDGCPAEQDDKFVVFWRQYKHPTNRGSKSKAQKKFQALSKTIDIDKCLRGYLRYCAKNPWYTPKMAVSWLKDEPERWLDQPDDEPKAFRRRKPAPLPPIPEYSRAQGSTP